MQTARTIRVTIDISGAKKGASELKNELRGIADAARTSAQSQSDLTRAANDNGRALSNVSREAAGAGRAMDSLNGFVRAFIGMAAAKYVIGLADAYTRFGNSLRVAGVEGTNAQLVTERLFASAQKYGVQLEAMGGLYGKASQAQKNLNASQSDLLKFTDGVAAALKVQGGSVTDAAGALHQLGQVLSGTKVQAEEYNSIIDGAYPILQAVAAGSDKYKGSVAALTQAVKAGKVESKQFFEDFLKGSASLEARAAKANFTVASSYQVLENALTKYVGEVDRANLATATLGGTMRGIGQNLDTIAPIVTTLGLALGVGFVVRAVAAQAAATGAATAMGAMALTARAAGASLLAAFGGPIGIAITAVGLGLVSIYNDAQNTKAAFDDTAQAADKFGMKLSEASKAAMIAAGETAGVGTSASGAEPAIWSFSNASGNLTKQLYEQAKAARVAQVAMLRLEISKTQQRIQTGENATRGGIQRNVNRATQAYKEGDYLAGIGYDWQAIKDNGRDLLSGGRTAREGQALATDNRRLLETQRMQLAIAEGAAINPRDLPTGAGRTTPAATGKPDKKDGGASDAERKAKAQAEFWKGLEKEVELSKLTTQQAEQRRREMEIEELTGRKIIDLDKARVAAGKETVAQLIKQREANQFITQANEQNRTAEIDYQTSKAVYLAKLRGDTDEQIAVEKAGLELKAQIQKSNLELTKEETDKLIEQARLRAQENADLEKNRLLTAGIQAAEKYSATYSLSQQKKGFDDEREGLTTLYNNGQNPKFTKEMFEEAIKGLDQSIAEAARAGSVAMQNHWGSTISDLGNQIEGKWGSAFTKIGNAIQAMVRATQGDFAGGGVLGALAGLFGKTVGPGGKLVNNTFGDAVQGGATKWNDQLWGNKDKGIKSALSDPLKSMSKSIDGFKDAFDPKKGGSIVKGLGNALGGAMQGAQMGSQISGVGKAIWGKFSSTGSQLGGALGSIGGPIGSAIGSLVGGIAGGLLKKTKYGTATIAQLAGGELGVGGIRGNSGSMKHNSSGAAGQVAGSLEEIAAQLGATITGSPTVSIGRYKGKWRVSNTGRTGKLKGKYGDVEDFGKDGAEAAIAYAVQEALKDGILGGISEFSKRVIQQSGDEKALNLAKSYESILTSLGKFNNPIKGAVAEAVKDIDTLAQQMKKAGATSAELANVEEYRSKKLKELMDDQLSGFQDTLKMIRGDASGKSDLTLFKEEMAQVNSYRATIASGGTVDSDKFNSLIQSVVGRAGDIWGRQTTQYQSVLGDLGSLVDTAMANSKTEFEKAADASKQNYEATLDQTQQVTSRLDTTNGILEGIYGLLAGQGSGFTGGARNGQLLNAN